MKKYLVLLAALLCLCLLTACGGGEDDIPDGYQLAIVDGVPFRLYVPSTWTLNTGSGLSGAYFSMENKAMVSADHVFTDEPLAEYMEACRASYGTGLAEYKEIEYADALLDGTPAKKLIYEAKFAEVTYRILSYTAPHGSAMITFTYSAPTDVYESYIVEVAEMVELFTFGVMAVPGESEADDREAPEGMKAAYGENSEYLFYIPADWTIDTRSQITSAYCSLEDRSNVSVTSYSPTVSMGIDEYFAMCEKEYEKELDSYARVESGEREMAERLARYYVYTARSGETEYKFLQCIVVAGEMFYTLTYTATADRYDLHIAEVERMITEFRFR